MKMVCIASKWHIYYCFSVAVPSAPPINISTSSITSSSAILSWSEPPLRHHNGIIIGYSVSLWQHDMAMMVYTTNTTSLSLTTLTPFTSYNIAVTARTSKGLGPYSKSLVFETFQDGKKFSEPYCHLF